MESVDERISTKIFIGCVLTSEIKMFLSQSSAWRRAQLAGDSLKELRYHEKDYIGTLLSSSEISLKDIQSEEKRILEQLESYCPELDVSEIPMVVFPQIFLS